MDALICCKHTFCDLQDFKDQIKIPVRQGLLQRKSFSSQWEFITIASGFYALLMNRFR
jgi:hypothetical protein